MLEPRAKPTPPQAARGGSRSQPRFFTPAAPWGPRCMGSLLYARSLGACALCSAALAGSPRSQRVDALLPYAPLPEALDRIWGRRPQILYRGPARDPRSHARLRPPT